MDDKKAVTHNDKQSRTALLAALAVALISAPILNGLTFSESVTAFIIDSDLASVIRRSVDFAYASPLYYCLTWAVSHLTSHDELGLRYVSMAASLITLFLIYSFRTSAKPSADSLIAIVVLCLSPHFISASYAAEPFALGVMFLVLSIKLWLKFLERRSFLVVIAHLTVFIAAVYVSYSMFIPLLLTHLALWVNGRSKIRPRWRAVVFYGSALLVLIAPALMHFVELISRPEIQDLAVRFSDYSLSSINWISNLIPWLSVCLVFGLSLFFQNHDESDDSSHAHTCDPLVVIGTTLSIAGCISILLFDRIFPHIASLAFVGLAQVTAKNAAKSTKRRELSFLISVLAIGFATFAPPTTEYWRDAAQFLNHQAEQGIDKDSTVLLLPNIPQAESVEFYRKRDAGKFLSAPFLFYRVPQMVVPAGFSNFTESIDAGTFSGLIVYAGPSSSIDLSKFSSTKALVDFGDLHIFRITSSSEPLELAH